MEELFKGIAGNIALAVEVVSALLIAYGAWTTPIIGWEIKQIK
jgi:hypothetical protein